MEHAQKRRDHWPRPRDFAGLRSRSRGIQRLSRWRPLATLLLVITAGIILSSPRVTAVERLDARSIVERAHRAAGGEAWRNVQTLKLTGEARFYRGGNIEAASHADSYRMWRILPQQSSDAHAANGMVRFDARRGNTTIFQIAFDGESSYDQNGRIDDAAATERWKSNFGFGIIRFALEPGFNLTRMADDQVEGHPCHFVRVTDPEARDTLFAIDSESYAIRLVGFDSPQGFHHRIYGDFQRRDGLSFSQPGHVRLYYDGVKTADIRWRDFTVNEDIPVSTFRLPAPATATHGIAD